MHSSKDGRHTQDQQHTFTLDEEFVNGRHPACRALRLASAASNLRFPVHTRTHARIRTRLVPKAHAQSLCRLYGRKSIIIQKTVLMQQTMKKSRGTKERENKSHDKTQHEAYIRQQKQHRLQAERAVCQLLLLEECCWRHWENLFAVRLMVDMFWKSVSPSTKSGRWPRN